MMLNINKINAFFSDNLYHIDNYSNEFETI